MPTLSRRQLLLAAPAAVLVPGGAGAAPFEVLAHNPQQLQTPLAALDGLLTPTERFFVRSHFGPPRLDRARPLAVTGRVSREGRWSQAALRKLPARTVTAVLQCAGNGRALFHPPVPGVQWQHGALGQARWTGVPLATLLERAGLQPGAAHVHLFGADRAPRPQTPPFIRSIPLDKALHPDTLVAWEMNGAPLTLEHGAPLRLVVPGWAGDHWLKWLVGIEVSAEEHSGFFVQKAYRIPPTPVPPGTRVPPEQMEPVTVMPVKSLITAPAEGADVAAGPQEVRGIAFSGHAPVERVEVSVDGGQRWERAALEGEPGTGRWQVFRLQVQAPFGPMTAMARATDAAGNVQPEAAAWNPSGYFWNAWHRVSWRVT
jgi:sulfite oxidase